MKDIIKINANLLSKLHDGGLKINAFDKEILVLVCDVAGTQFYPTEKILVHLKKETALMLKREKDNKYDTMAVAVYYHETQIGHLPRNRNECIARLLDAGKTFIAKISDLEDIGAKLNIEISVYLKD